MGQVPTPSGGMGLYAGLLGPAWEQLPPVVRHFHGMGESFTARGTFGVQHGGNRLARFLAWAARLPVATAAVPLRLEVNTSPRGEEWRRTFGDRLFLTWQAPRPNGLLAERVGLMELWLRLEVRDGALCFATVRAALCLGRCRLPLPRWLSPWVTAREEAAADGAGCAVTVEAGLPLLGRIIAYHGTVIRNEAAS